MSEAVLWTLESTIKSDKRKDLFALERYASSEAAPQHLGAMGPKLGALMECFEAPPVFHVYGNPTDEPRAAVTDFRPRYFARVGGFRR